jgi:Type II secretory pathway, pseudopilin PulG
MKKDNGFILLESLFALIIFSIVLLLLFSNFFALYNNFYQSLKEKHLSYQNYEQKF